MAKITKGFVKIEKRFYLTFKQQLVWMLSTGFAIAAAIVWKDVIMLTMKRYITVSTELAYSVYSALAITIIGVFVIWLANEIFKNK